MDLTALLREFGADDALVALADTWTARPAAGDEPPADYTPLTDEELQTLHDGLVALGEDDEAGLGLIMAAADTAVAIRDEQGAREAALEQEEADIAEARARLRGEEPEASDAGDGDGGDDEGDAGGEGDDGEGDEGAGDEGAGDESGSGTPAEGEAERQPEPVAASSRSARRQRARAHQPVDEPPAQASARITLAADLGPITASGAGGTVTLEDIDRALIHRHESFRRASRTRDGENVLVASIEANYPEDRILTDDGDRNGAIVGQVIREATTTQALAASGGRCAPLVPYYGVPILGDDYRPVRDALPAFQASQGAARGGVQQIAPPILPNLAGSSIIWTEANDADPSDPETKPCLRIECGTPRETELYAIPMCLEFGNWVARTYGELTEAWSNLALVANARLAEVTLLAAIKAASTEPNGIDTVTSAVADTLVALDQAATGMRSRHRLPQSFPFRVIGSETWLFQARTNMARALPGGSFQENLTLAEAAIRGWFASRNLMPTFSPDLGIMGQQAAATALAEPDPTQEWAIYPEATFMFLDGGRLDLGVVRDSTLNATNDFQVWSENFEAVHKLGVESMWLTINTCPSGAVFGTLDPAAFCATYT